MNEKWKSRTYTFVVIAFIVVTVFVPFGWLSEGTWKFVFAVGAGAWTIKKGLDKLGEIVQKMRGKL
jgi:hypothetical protein